MLDRQDEWAKRVLDPRALLLEQHPPGGIIIADDDRPCPVFLHARPTIVERESISQRWRQTYHERFIAPAGRVFGLRRRPKEFGFGKSGAIDR